ncbi:hypothetical protein PCASD_23582 [Puccinia coronata f. sp. avenae]|uniref:Uncharacterized protein n=1 Tax=Puccinia coronata f. sp. avenae TaxID=200324 RepID=A0A2N5TUZ9_9BASI|nr:hypothetical protein PCASD_23582 [Puccinia coronata f. sp. avenae]
MDTMVMDALKLTEQQKLAYNACPACFGLEPPNLHKYPVGTKNQLIVCLDGSFQHRQHSKASLVQEQLAAINANNELTKDQNDISRKRLVVEQKRLIIEEQCGQSEVQMNDLKMLREREEDLEDTKSKRVLQIMKEKIQNKWLSPDA